MGSWLLRRWRHMLEKQEKARELVGACGIRISFLREQWAAQVKAQTLPRPRAYLVALMTGFLANIFHRAIQE